MPGDHFVQNRPQRKNVGTGIGRLTPDLLRGHVSYRAEHDAGGGGHHLHGRALVRRRLRPRQFRQSKIENLYPPIVGDEDIFRLQIAMNDPFVVRRRQALRDLRAVVDDSPHRQRRTAQLCPQGLTLQALGDQIRRTLIGADVVNRKNVGVVQRRNRPRLGFKSLQPFGVPRQLFRQNLDGNIPTQPGIFGTVDFAHAARAARAERRLNFIRAESCARGERHSRGPL